MLEVSNNAIRKIIKQYTEWEEANQIAFGSRGHSNTCKIIWKFTKKSPQTKNQLQKNWMIPR